MPANAESNSTTSGPKKARKRRRRPQRHSEPTVGKQLISFIKSLWRLIFNQKQVDLGFILLIVIIVGAHVNKVTHAAYFPPGWQEWCAIMLFPICAIAWVGSRQLAIRLSPTEHHHHDQGNDHHHHNRRHSAIDEAAVRKHSRAPMLVVSETVSAIQTGASSDSTLAPQAGGTAELVYVVAARRRGGAFSRWVHRYRLWLVTGLMFLLLIAGLFTYVVAFTKLTRDIKNWDVDTNLVLLSEEEKSDPAASARKSADEDVKVLPHERVIFPVSAEFWKSVKIRGGIANVVDNDASWLHDALEGDYADSIIWSDAIFISLGMFLAVLTISLATFASRLRHNPVETEECAESMAEHLAELIG